MCSFICLATVFSISLEIYLRLDTVDNSFFFMPLILLVKFQLGKYINKIIDKYNIDIKFLTVVKNSIYAYIALKVLVFNLVQSL